MAKKTYADPAFAAEMERLREENRQRFLSRPPGDGVVGTESATKDLGPRDYPPASELRSTFRPSKETT